MNKNGREFDVLIEDEKFTDQRTGVVTVSDKSFTAWADKGLQKVIEDVEGITNVFNFDTDRTEYHVYVDPRYNFEFIKKEVEAVLIVATR